MTDKDIIKALECCCNSVKCDENCPLIHTSSITDCNKKFLDLIKCQQAEIERLERHTKMHDEIQAEAKLKELQNERDII